MKRTGLGRGMSAQAPLAFSTLQQAFASQGSGCKTATSSSCCFDCCTRARSVHSGGRLTAQVDTCMRVVRASALHASLLCAAVAPPRATLCRLNVAFLIATLPNCWPFGFSVQDWRVSWRVPGCNLRACASDCDRQAAAWPQRCAPLLLGLRAAGREARPVRLRPQG